MKKGKRGWGDSKNWNKRSNRVLWRLCLSSARRSRQIHCQSYSNEKSEKREKLRQKILGIETKDEDQKEIETNATYYRWSKSLKLDVIITDRHHRRCNADLNSFHEIESPKIVSQSVSSYWLTLCRPIFLNVEFIRIYCFWFICFQSARICCSVSKWEPACYIEHRTRS